MINKKLIPLCIMILLVMSAQGQHVRNSLEQEIDRLVSDHTLVQGDFGLYVHDINDNRTVAAHQADKSLIPASTQKILTTAYALQTLGENHTFKTELGYSGEIKGNTLHGNLIVKGFGDPALLSNYHEEHYKNILDSWADSIKNKGIDTITGSIIMDASYFGAYNTPPDWFWNDMGNYYGASPFAINVEDNRFEVYFNSTAGAGNTTTITGTTAPYDITIDNHVIGANTSRDMAYFYSAPLGEQIWAKGKIPQGQRQFIVKASIPNPPKHLGMLLKQTLHRNGIVYTEEIEVEFNKSKSYNLLATQHSPKLIDIILTTNQRSHNLFAETLLLHLCKEKQIDTNTQYAGEALKLLMQQEGIDLTGANIRDGSGLSRSNLITAKQMTEVLVALSKDKEKWESFISTLPKAGREGSLASIFQNTSAVDRLVAKSGYLNKARSYSGFITTKSGKEICFTLIANNYTCTAYQMKKKMERLMIQLCEL